MSPDPCGHQVSVTRPFNAWVVLYFMLANIFNFSVVKSSHKRWQSSPVIQSIEWIHLFMRVDSIYHKGNSRPTWSGWLIFLQKYFWGLTNWRIRSHYIHNYKHWTCYVLAKKYIWKQPICPSKISSHMVNICIRANAHLNIQHTFLRSVNISAATPSTFAYTQFHSCTL